MTKNKVAWKRHQWQVVSKTTPNDPCLLVFMSLCDPLPLNGGYTWRVTSNEQKTATNATSGLGYRRLVSIYCCSLLFSRSLGLREASCHVASCPMDRHLLVQGTERGLWPTASEGLRPSVQQPVRKLSPANNHESVPRSGSSSKRTFSCVLSPANSVTARSGKALNQRYS